MARLRVSSGLDVDKYGGVFHRRTATDIDLPALNADQVRFESHPPHAALQLLMQVPAPLSQPPDRGYWRCAGLLLDLKRGDWSVTYSAATATTGAGGDAGVRRTAEGRGRGVPPVCAAVHHHRRPPPLQVRAFSTISVIVSQGARISALNCCRPYARPPAQQILSPDPSCLDLLHFQ